MTNKQKINKLFRLVPSGGGGGADLYLFGKEFSKFLISEKTEKIKRDFIRNMFNNLSPRMDFFSSLSKFVVYKVTSDDILLSLKDYSYSNIFDFIKDVNKHYGENLSKEIYQKLLKDAEIDSDLKDFLRSEFPKFS